MFKFNIKMKSILLAGIFLFVFAFRAQASEITGRISTDPTALTTETVAVSPEATPVVQNIVPAPNSGGAILAVRDIPPRIVAVEKKIEPREMPKIPDTPRAPAQKIAKVLGALHYPDGSLLRSPSRQIYQVKRGVKKLIPNILALQKYRGQAIHDSTPEDLANFETRSNLERELIRQKGTARVYVILQGIRKHILNLEELRAHFFGLEIFNIRKEEMKLFI
jgi:hypothetical protein